MEHKSAVPPLSSYAQRSLVPAPVNRMMAEFSAGFRSGVDVNLGVGYVNEATMPSAAITEAVQYVLSHGDEYPHALNYGMPSGEPVFIESLKRFLVRNRIGAMGRKQWDERSFLVGASGVTSLLEGLASVLEPGIVITTDPSYYIYTHLLERLGFEIVPVLEDEGGISLPALEQALRAHGRDVRFVYLVGVGNPTSAIVSNARRRGVVEAVTAASRRVGLPIPLVVDTAYELLVHDPAAEQPVSALQFDTDGLVYELGTLSKVLAPALRVGYLVGPSGVLYDALLQRVNDVGFSAPALNQFIAARLLDVCADEHRRSVNHGYRQKAQLAIELAREHLGDQVEAMTGGQAGFYLFVTLRETHTSEGSDFFNFAVRATGDRLYDGPAGANHARVLYLPGEHFVNRHGALTSKAKRQMRISYGFASDDDLRRAFEILGQALACAQRQVR